MSNDQRKVQVKYSMKLGPWDFVFSLKFSILAIIFCSILVYLGSWQMDRAAQKKQLLQDLRHKSVSTPVNLASLNNPDLLRDRFTAVEFDGVYLNKFTFLLDNQIFKHQAGYRVITAAQSPYLKRLVLIDRGWIPAGATREIKPQIKDIYGLQKITGIINNIASGIALQLKSDALEENWPEVIQTLDYKAITTMLQHEVFPFLVQLNEGDPNSFVTPPLDFGLPSDKHIAYAMEWYSFAALVIIYYFFLSLKRRNP